jgi:hypothetical protein
MTETIVRYFTELRHAVGEGMSYALERKGGRKKKKIQPE